MSFWKKKLQEEESNKEVTDSGIKAESLAPSEAPGKKEQAVEQKASAPASNQPASAPESDFAQNISKVRSALSAGTVIQGKLSFDTPVRIDGKLNGEIYSSKALFVGETAQIDAKIEASILVVMGKIKGTVNASEKVQICSGAVFEGVINSPSLVIENGAIFNGSCEMKKAAGYKSAGSSASTDSRKDTSILTADDNLDLEDELGKSSGSAVQAATPQG